MKRITGRQAVMTLAGIIIVALVAVWQWSRNFPPLLFSPWRESEQALIYSLSLSRLPPPPPSPGNAIADDPRAAQLGRALFHDPALSINGEIACASCHDANRFFTDGMSRGQGLGRTGRNTMTIIGSAWSPWQYWDGRRDSLWSQALTPLEHPDEQGNNRLHIVRTVLNDPDYRREWRTLFGEVPMLDDHKRFPEHAGPGGRASWVKAWEGMRREDRQYVNTQFARVGKLLAAWQRTLQPPRTRFDDYADTLQEKGAEAADTFLNDREKQGLRLFIGKAGCIDCHNGPLFTNNEFHNTGVLSAAGELPDKGRIDGLRQLLADPFNCLGPYSDAEAEACTELRFVRRGDELLGAFRTPGLRHVADTAPYMHRGQLETLHEVIAHYDEAPEAMIGHNEAEQPLGLSRGEKLALEAFLVSLSEASGSPAEHQSSAEPVSKK